MALSNCDNQERSMKTRYGGPRKEVVLIIDLAATTLFCIQMYKDIQAETRAMMN